MGSYCNRSTVETARQLAKLMPPSIASGFIQRDIGLWQEGFSLIVVIVWYSFCDIRTSIHEIASLSIGLVKAISSIAPLFRPATLLPFAVRKDGATESILPLPT